MGFCGAAGEGDMEEDFGEAFEAAAVSDEILQAAKLVMRLSQLPVILASRLLPPQPTPPPAELAWGRKGPRSRTITREGIRAAEREEEEAGRASPTTPLSWSADGCSGLSGSVCGGGKASRPRKRARGGEAEKGRRDAAGGKRIRVPPAEGTKHEAPRDGETAANALGSASSVAVSNKVVAAAAAAVAAAHAVGKPVAADPVACPEPLRWRSPAVAPVVVGRQRKKKTLAELQTMEESLLQEQAGLRKELESHKALFDALLEENTRLRMVELLPPLAVLQRESSPASADTAPVPGKEAMPVLAMQTQHVDSSDPAVASPCPASAAVPEQKEEEQEGGRSSGEPQSSSPSPIFHFDLNCTPLENGDF